MFDTIQATNPTIAIPANTKVNIVVSKDAVAPTAEGATVVKNDTQALTQHKPVYEQLTDLVKQSQTWEETVYKTSNEHLYSILQSCYAIYYKAGMKDTAKTLNEALERVAKERGYKFLSSTHTISKIVKCVFGADRRRVSAYSIALRAASSAKKKPEDIPAFIRDGGGVEELRLAKSPNTLNPKQKAERAEQAVSQTELATLKTDAISEKLDAAKCGRMLVLVATQNEDGSVTINTVVRNDTVVRAALAAVYSENKNKLANSAAEVSIADDAAKMDTLMADAVAAANEIANHQQTG